MYQCEMNLLCQLLFVVLVVYYRTYIYSYLGTIACDGLQLLLTGT